MDIKTFNMNNEIADAETLELRGEVERLRSIVEGHVNDGLLAGALADERIALRKGLSELVEAGHGMVAFCLHCDMDGLEEASEPERSKLQEALSAARAVLEG